MSLTLGPSVVPQCAAESARDEALGTQRSAALDAGAVVVGAVVVGIAATTPWQAPVAVAAALATQRGQRLLLVTVVEPVAPEARGWGAVPLPPPAQSAAAEGALSRARKAAAARAPGVETGTYLAVDRPVPGLLAPLQPEDILVLGSSSGADPLRLVPGPVAAALAQWAPCPTVLVGRSRDAAGRIDAGGHVEARRVLAADSLVVGHPGDPSLLPLARSLASDGADDPERIRTYAWAGRAALAVLATP